MKLLAWDLETTNLAASFGSIICCGLKTVGQGKAEVLDFASYRGNILEAERKMLVDVSARLLEADCWLTWYGTYFDIPYINTRLLYHELPTLPANFPHIDGWKTARNRLKLGNNRLNTVQQFLGLRDEKTHILAAEWLKSLAGDKKALHYVTDHCRKDVLVLEEAYMRLRPLILDHPSKSLIDNKGGCSVCGSTRIERRGFHTTRTRKYQRFHCLQCGSWSKGMKPIMTAPQA